MRLFVWKLWWLNQKDLSDVIELFTSGFQITFLWPWLLASVTSRVRDLVTSHRKAPGAVCIWSVFFIRKFSEQELARQQRRVEKCGWIGGICERTKKLNMKCSTVLWNKQALFLKTIEHESRCFLSFSVL